MFNLSRYRRLIEAVIESAAIYSLASISLLGTFVASPDTGYLVCMCAFPPLIVRSPFPPTYGNQVQL